MRAGVWGGLFLMAIGSANACSQVQTEVIHPVQLGNIRLNQGDVGWVYLDPKGAFDMSAAMSRSTDLPATVGKLRVKGPDGSRIHMRLAELNSENREARSNFRLNSFHLSGSAGVEIERVSSHEFTLIMPTAQEPRNIEATVSVGIEATVGPVLQRQDHQLGIRVECLAVTY